MPRGLTEFELCEKHHNENAHTEHVALLALRLFDRTRRALRTPASDRRLLEAACRLHDVGYFSDHLSHPRRSAAIVLEEGLAGFTPTQRAIVAGVAFLHAGEGARSLTDPLIAGHRDRPRILRLGAYLRVADALDHAHIQDVSIRSVRIADGAVQLTLKCGGYAGSVEWADRKADLWRQVFPLGIRFKALRTPIKAPEFRAGVSANDSVLAAARRFLFLQFRLMDDNARKALTGDAPEYLHDMRVAMRRFRSGLRFFGKPLAGTAARRLNRSFLELCRQLGPLRDMQVWVAFLENPERLAACSGDAGWSDFLAGEHRELDARMQERRGILAGEDYAGIVEETRFFLRAELPDLLKRGKSRPLAPFALRRVRRLFRQILKLKVRRSGMTPEEMHALRRLCRRGRYWAELTGAVQGGVIRKLARYLKAVADALGDLHDMDVHLQNVQAGGRSLPALEGLMMKRRSVALTDFDKAWRRLRRKELRTQVMREKTKEGGRT